jgi:cytochrome c556
MKSMKKTGIAGGILALVLGGAVMVAGAREMATGVVKERQDVMKEMGGAMKQIGLMMKGIMPFDGAAISQAAMVINQNSAKLDKLFPKGGDQAGSYAKPEMFDNSEAVKELAKATGMAAEKLSEAAFDGSKADVLPLFFGVGKSCKACHTKYRRAKDNQ